VPRQAGSQVPRQAGSQVPRQAVSQVPRPAHLQPSAGEAPCWSASSSHQEVVDEGDDDGAEEVDGDDEHAALRLVVADPRADILAPPGRLHAWPGPHHGHRPPVAAAGPVLSPVSTCSGWRVLSQALAVTSASWVLALSAAAAHVIPRPPWPMPASPPVLQVEFVPGLLNFDVNSACQIFPYKLHFLA